jgi:hypothetical protein
MYVRKDCAVGGSGALRNYIMDDDDWKAIELVASWLKIFRHATVQMSTTKKPMLSTTHAVFRGLQAELKNTIANLPVEIDLSLRGGLVDAHWKLSEYFYKFDQSEYCSWACRTCLLANLHIQLTFTQFSILAFRMSDYTRTISPSRNCTPASRRQNLASRRISSPTTHRRIRQRRHLRFRTRR